MGVSPFDKTAKPDDSKAMMRQIRSWADELHDVIFEIEENVVADGDEYDRLRDVYKSMEDLLDSVRDETRSANSPHRSTRGR